MNSTDITKQNINAILIVEVMGKPKEYLTETLEKITNDMAKEVGVELVEKKINTPKLIKNQKDLFSSYAEVEIKVETAFQLAILMFKYMPAHVDIMEPENFKIPSIQYNDVLNEVLGRLHKYDELMRVLQLEKNILTKKVQELEVKK